MTEIESETDLSPLPPPPGCSIPVPGSIYIGAKSLVSMKAFLLLLALAVLSAGCTGPDDNAPTTPPVSTDESPGSNDISPSSNGSVPAASPEPTVDSCFVQIDAGAGAPEQGISAYMHCPFSKLTSDLSVYAQAIVEIVWENPSPGITRVRSALVDADCNQSDPLAPCSLAEQWHPADEIGRFDVDAAFLDDHAASDLKAYTAAEGVMAQQAVYIWISLFPDGLVPAENYSAIEN